MWLWETPLCALFRDDETLKSVTEMSPEAQKLLAGFKVRQTWESVYNEDGELEPERVARVEVVDIRLIDRLKVLDMIGRHTVVNAFGDKEKSEAAGSFAELLRALTSAVADGQTLDAELVQTLVGEKVG